MDDLEMTICECTEAISELTQDEAIDEMLTYIEVKARSMVEKLEERKREAERQKARIDQLEKALDKACQKLYSFDLDTTFVGYWDAEAWKEWCLHGDD